jgi:hypothetical protein
MAAGLWRLGRHPEPKGSLVRHHGIGGEKRGVIDEYAGVAQKDFAEVAVVVVPRQLDRSSPMVRLSGHTSAIEALLGARIASSAILRANTTVAIHFLLEAISPRLRTSRCRGPAARGLMGSLRQEGRQLGPVLGEVAAAGELWEGRGGF